MLKIAKLTAAKALLDRLMSDADAIATVETDKCGFSDCGEHL